MSNFRTFTSAVCATALLALTPLSHAQTVDELRTMQVFLDIMTDYFKIIEATHAINSSTEKAAIAQMMKIQEVYEERGEKARSVAVLQEVLERTRNPAIRNAAFMMIGDTLKEAGRSDEAIAELRRGLNENIAATE